MVEALRACGFAIEVPGGAFYLWVPAADGDGAALTRWFAGRAGLLVTPGATYGPDGAGFVRLALVQPDADIDRGGGAPRGGGRGTGMTGRGGRAPGMMGR